MLGIRTSGGRETRESYLPRISSSASLEETALNEKPTTGVKGKQVPQGMRRSKTHPALLRDSLKEKI